MPNRDRVDATRKVVRMSVRKLFSFFTISLLLWWLPLASAQATSEQDFNRALLNLQKALIVQSMYQAIFNEPDRCAPAMGSAYSDMANDFRRKYPEFISLVEASELLPDIKEGLRIAYAQPAEKSKAFDECAEIAAMLRDLMNDEDGKQHVEEMTQILKQ